MGQAQKLSLFSLSLLVSQKNLQRISRELILESQVSNLVKAEYWVNVQTLQVNNFLLRFIFHE